ncbi:MAG: thioredoxin domain-containing protein [bacterium]|nr:thioredoxin domain-containing protein [bacterium]
MENSYKKTNRLINSLSPYLIQHAHNPVDWYEWGEEAFEKARTENKLMIVSIGYSACHWCHVMAHECFEDDATAAIMNENFVCIKIDREELPDVDQIYMDACQLVNGNGGWPLNAFTLPDKRPLHAMTYAPKERWQEILLNLHGLWQKEPTTAIDYAKKLSQGIANMSLAPALSDSDNHENISTDVLSVFEAQYDTVYGGPKRAPKFPMPSNYRYLLQYGVLKNNDLAKNMGLFTLKQMALGGIYDAVGGGFARYSVDNRWFAPHFEKMLYDNAQLISLYSYAYAVSQNYFYKKIALETLAFCNSEMKSKSDLFYSAYDADSEGVEGLYYTFTYDELTTVLGAEAGDFCRYYQCIPSGNWEEGRNILYAIDTIDKASQQLGIEEQKLEALVANSLVKLKTFRSKRIAPGLDDKCICSWNNLMLKALAEAAIWLNEPQFSGQSNTLADTILKIYYSAEGLKRTSKNEHVKIDAFLEDYATLIDGLITTYQATFNETHLLKAKEICEYTIANFYNKKNGFFEFNSNNSETLIAPKYDVNDDVISSGNSIMAHNLWRLSFYFSHTDWYVLANTMLNALTPSIKKSAPWYSHWAALQLFKEEGTHQIILSGPEDLRNTLPLKQYYIQPNAIVGFAGKVTAIPLFEGKQYKGEALVYLCKDYVCNAPEAYSVENN